MRSRKPASQSITLTEHGIEFGRLKDLDFDIPWLEFPRLKDLNFDLSVPEIDIPLSGLPEGNTGRRKAARCGARRKRDGQPCVAKALKNGRCKFHGGMSTGPKTPEGRARGLANLRQNRHRR